MPVKFRAGCSGVMVYAICLKSVILLELLVRACGSPLMFDILGPICGRRGPGRNVVGGELSIGPWKAPLPA